MLNTVVTPVNSRVETFHTDLAISWKGNPGIFLPHSLAAYATGNIGADDLDSRKHLHEYAGREVAATLKALYRDAALPSDSYSSSQKDGYGRPAAWSSVFKFQLPDGPATKVNIGKSIGEVSVGMTNTREDSVVVSNIEFNAAFASVAQFLGITEGDPKRVVAFLGAGLFGATFPESMVKQVGNAFILDSAAGSIEVYPDAGRKGGYLWRTQVNFQQGMRYQMSPKTRELFEYLSTGEIPSTPADRT